MSSHRPATTLVTLALLAVTAISACGSGAPNASASGPASPGSSDVAAACPTAPAVESTGDWTGAAQDVIPYVISGQITCGGSRIMFTLLDSQNRPVASPDRPVSVGFYDLGRDSTKPVVTADATFIWAIEGERGVYAVNANLPEAGTWGLELTSPTGTGASPTLRVTTDVQSSSTVVKVGDHAPSIDSPTLADVGGDVSKISTDPTPDPTFYQTSISDALAAHKPFVLVFATPKFCVSAQCGPTLDRLKPIAAANPNVTFINVEPYQLHDVDGQLQPVLDAKGQLQATDVTDAWGLYTEPWIFAVDGDGIVRGSFELIASDQEITDAIATITKPS